MTQSKANKTYKTSEIVKKIKKNENNFQMIDYQ